MRRSVPPAPPSPTTLPDAPPPPFVETPRPGRISEKGSARREATAPAYTESGFRFERVRSYSFALGPGGEPVEIGSGRFARVYLGFERRGEASADAARPVVIKMMQRDMDEGDATRFRMEKALLEHLQGHPSIVELISSGSITDPGLPDGIWAECEGDYLVLERLDMNLEERLKGSRDPRAKEDLLALDIRDRLLRVLEYMVPVASAIEFAHIERNVCHRNINPSNVLIRLPDPKLAGSTMQIRLADFSAAKMEDQEGVTRFAFSVPGTMYFQSPEQEVNILELLVNVKHGSKDVEYFEDLFVNVAKNDTFAIFNHTEEYPIASVDRVKKRITLDAAYRGGTEQNVRAHVQKSVGRPADIYSLGALFYYLISGATRSPKALNDTFVKFVEYSGPAETNTIEGFLRGEYAAIEAARARTAESAPGDMMFPYQQFTDGTGAPIPIEIMTVIARAMIRNKADSYCQGWDLDTTGVTTMLRDVVALYGLLGLRPTAAVHHTVVHASSAPRGASLTLARTTNAIGKLYESIVAFFRRRR